MADCKSSGPTAVISAALVNWVKRLRPFGKLRLEVVRRCDDVKGFKVLPRRWVVKKNARSAGCLSRGACAEIMKFAWITVRR